jgi:antitoxin Phd
MHTASWRLQEAKNQFSKVVDAALHGEPQRVTRRGRDAVVRGCGIGLRADVAP